VNDKGTPNAGEVHYDEVPRGKVPNVVTRSCASNQRPPSLSGRGPQPKEA
jgi:hypothetical protein